jgi:hypothetical protein
MTVMAVTPEPNSQAELVGDELRVRDMGFGGTIVEVARERGLEDEPERLTRLLGDAAEVGATVFRNGQSRAFVESVALEIDRLIETTSDESEKLPEALKESLADHLQRLSDGLTEYFDPKRAHSLQRQLPTIVGEATGAELRRLVQEVLSESGAVGAQLKLFSSSNTETLTRVNTLLYRIEQKLQLDDQVERSVHKGRPFEEIVQAELEAIHASLGDRVQCVRSDYGLLPKTTKGPKVGDYIVVLNPEHTRGREVCFVVEAKTGPLRSAEAKRELEAAIENRGAAAGVLVFDGLDDAPLGGRSYLPHGDGRFTAVLDLEHGTPLALEVACREARSAAIASVRAQGEVDKTWLLGKCDRLCEIVEGASAIVRGISTIERGTSKVRERYAEMRREALDLIDAMRRQAEE